MFFNTCLLGLWILPTRNMEKMILLSLTDLRPFDWNWTALIRTAPKGVPRFVLWLCFSVVTIQQPRQGPPNSPHCEVRRGALKGRGGSSRSVQLQYSCCALPSNHPILNFHSGLPLLDLNEGNFKAYLQGWIVTLRFLFFEIVCIKLDFYESVLILSTNSFVYWIINQQNATSQTYKRWAIHSKSPLAAGCFDGAWGVRCAE